MARIKYTLEFERIAVLQVEGKPYKAGEVTSFKQNEDGTLEIEVFLEPMMDEKMRKDIEKAPHILGIQSRPKLVTNQIILP